MLPEAPTSASRESTHSHPGYRPDIDGLRAVAILAVLANHIGLLPGGLVGVDVFFVISGYLISGIILGALARGRFSILDFYVLAVAVAGNSAAGPVAIHRDRERGARIPHFGLALRWQAAALGATFILAFLTYKYLERPVRTARNKRLLPALLCATMAACAGIGVLVFEQGITPRPEPAGVSKFSRATMEDWLPGTRGTFWTRFPSGFLEIGDGPRRVLYVGDSNMQQYYPRISRVLGDHAQNTHRAVFAVRDQCAPGAIEVAHTDDASRAACRAFMAHAFEYAQDPKVDTVVIAACWSCYFVPLQDILFVGKGGGSNPAATLR